MPLVAPGLMFLEASNIRVRQNELLYPARPGKLRVFRDHIGCNEPAIETQQSAPVALLLFSGGDCCAMTPVRFETELRGWLAASAGEPPWRVYAAIAGDLDQTVMIVNGTAPESRFIEVTIASEGELPIRGLTVGTFRTGPYLARPESLVPWP